MYEGRFDGRAYIVTGAARGQGQAHARRLLAEGAKVLLTDQLAEPETDNPSEFDNDSAFFLQHNVTSEEDWQRVVDAAAERFGRIDGLVNNAGISSRPPITDIDLDTWNLVISVNQTGTLLGIRSVVPHLRAAGGGSIVNIASLWAHTGGVGTGNVGYIATKNAVIGITKNAALDLGKDNIRVNSMSPGYLDHFMRGIPDPTVEAAIPRIPLGYLAALDDMASAVTFLLSDDARYISGIDLLVDGGLHLG